jgi:hypothetical protein
VGGTLGVAVIGSVFGSVYSGALAGKPGWGKLPAEALNKAEDGIGLAFGVAQGLGKTVSQSESETLLAGAIDSFMNGLHAGCAVAAGVTILGAILAAVFLPAQPNAAQVGALV